MPALLAAAARRLFPILVQSGSGLLAISCAGGRRVSPQ